MLDVTKIRKDFPILNKDDGLIYLDSAATSLKPKKVIDAVLAYYQDYTANIHRGDYRLSLMASELYDKARENVADFVNVSATEIIFTSGSTASLNQVAYQFGLDILQAGDVILTTETEHASSILPWYQVAKKINAKIEYVPLNNEGLITIENFTKAMHDQVKIVVTTHVSNVLGHVNPIKELARITHDHDGYIVVDGAQAIPHMLIDLKDLDVDFYAFSGHKMLAPTGVGVLYGKRCWLDKMLPLFYGGGSNARFDKQGNITLKNTPEKFEAGTPSIEGVLGLSAAIDYLRDIGMDNVLMHEEELSKYLLTKLHELNNVIIYNPSVKSGIIALNVKNIFSQDVAAYLDHHHIAVRSGNHCAKILNNVIQVTDTIRCSLYIYNTKEDIDEFIRVLKDVTLEKCIDLII
ncbi:MAG: cysteine desulfurase [Erysipelotrichaceae bacterium]|nr:cysteine desulfurase [Erysipelotrichaceae bacterium]